MARSIELARIFYTINAETQGLARDLKGAENQLGKFTAYVKANPMAAAGALGVALVGIGAKAVQMAEEVDRSFRRLSGLVPGLTANLKQAQRAVAELAVATGKSQEVLLGEAEAIARNGVSSTSDLLNRLRLVNELADATNADVATLAAGLDQTLDVFALAADKAGEVTAKLFAAGQGRVPMEDLFAALQAAAPAIRSLGLDFDTAAGALATLLDEGLSARQAGAALKEMAGEGAAGAERLRELAGAGISTAEAMAKLETATRLVRESASRSAASIQQEFNNQLIALGTRILPVVTAEMKGLVALMDRLAGRGRDTFLGAQVATARSLGQELAAGHLSARDELDTAEIQRFQKAVQDVRAGILQGRVDLAALSREELTQLRQAFEQFGRIKQVFAIDQGIEKQIDALLAVKPPSAGSGAGGAGGGPSEAAAALRLQLEAELAKYTESLADDTAAATKRFAAQMREQLGALAQSEQEALQPLVDQILQAMEARALLLRAAKTIATTPQVVGGTPKLGIRTDALERANEEIQRQVELQREAQEAAARARQEAIQQAQLQGQAIEQAARGALQLADAFGIVSDNAAEALANVAQIGAAVAQLSAFSKVKGGVDFTTMLPSILSIVGGITSLIGSLFGGQSPAEKAAEEERAARLAKNTEALESLTRSIGDLGKLSDRAGKDIGAVQSILTGLNPWDSGLSIDQLADPTRGISNFGEKLRADLALAGLSMSDLRDIAKELGLTWAKSVPTGHELLELLKALQETQLTQFAQTLTGQLQALQVEFDLFDITNPIDQLKKLQDIAKRFGTGDPRKLPLVLDTLGRIDISTEAGRKAAEEEIQRIFQLLQTGGLDPALLGDFSVDQLLAFLQQFEGLLDQAGSQGGAGDASQFAVQRTITEAQAGLLASLLTTDAYWNEQTARNTAAIAAALGASLPSGGLAPPPTPSQGAGGVTIETIQVTVTLPPGTDLSSGAAVGGAVAQGMVAQLDALLGQRLRVRKLLTGNVVQV